jgi:hypothetical protein
MIESLRAAADQLDEMRKAGVTLEGDGAEDHYAILVATDPNRARKFGMAEGRAYLVRKTTTPLRRRIDSALSHESDKIVRSPAVAAAQETRAGFERASGALQKSQFPVVVAPRSLTDSGSGQLGQALGVIKKISTDSCVIRVEPDRNVERLDRLFQTPFDREHVFPLPGVFGLLYIRFC